MTGLEPNRRYLLPLRQEVRTDAEVGNYMVICSYSDPYNYGLVCTAQPKVYLDLRGAFFTNIKGLLKIDVDFLTTPACNNFLT